MSLLAAALFTAHVALGSLEAPLARVSLELSGLPDGEVRLCLGRSRAARHLSGLPRAKDDDTCFLAQSKAGKLTARYQLDLGALAADSGDPDDATTSPGGLVFSDKALLALPEDADAELVMDLSLPAGVEAATPWAREGTTGARFRTTARQVRCGSYLAVGKFRSLGEVAAGAGSLRVIAFGDAQHPGDDRLRRWLAGPAQAAARFWGGLPKSILIVLLPASGADEPGVFGSVLREEAPSAVLWFGTESKEADMPGHWLAFHELFHLGQPALKTRLPWFTEGTATYYQEVLRARSGARPAAEMWKDLEEELRDLCDGGPPLAEQSRSLRRTHRYRQLYWKGACAAFQLDLAIRARTGGRRSLDDALRALSAAAKAADLDEDTLVERLDAESGGLATRAVRGQMPPIEGVLGSLDPKTRDAIFAKW